MELPLHPPPTVSTTATRAAVKTTPPPQHAASNPALPMTRAWSRRWFFHQAVVPGLGLLCESYWIFSVGTLGPLWVKVLGDQDNTLHTQLSHSVVCGIVTGMLLLGAAADRLGRQWGSRTTAGLMCAGAMGLFGASILARSDSNQAPAWLTTTMAVSFFVLGLGVGGEYPLAASSASEQAMAQQAQQPTTPIRRGQQIQFVFSMQGVGILLHSAVLTLLFWIWGSNDDSTAPLLWIWRIVYGLGVVLASFVFVYRWRHLRESSVWERDQQEQKAEATDRTAQRHVPLAGPSQPAAAAYSPPQRPSSPPLSHVSTDVSELTASTVPWTIMSGSGNGAAFAKNKLTPEEVEDAYYQEMVQQQKKEKQQLPNTPPKMAHPAVPEEPMLIDSDGLAVASTKKTRTLSSLSWWLLLLRHYGVRLLGASTCWFLWDVAFYGNKLFQSTFLLALTQGKQQSSDDATSGLLALSGVTTLNAAVALLGYWGAALLVDHPNVGRRRLQVFGFVLTGALFVAVAFGYSSLNQVTLVALYLASSFFGQLGPNATTFLLPAEIFPTQMRTLCHGICAASGKLGALAAAIVFGHSIANSSSSDDDNADQSHLDLFLCSGYASFAACLVTVWTLPETMGLDLTELDKKWHCILQGRDYQGDANRPKFLSWYERQSQEFLALIHNNNNSKSSQQQHQASAPAVSPSWYGHGID